MTPSPTRIVLEKASDYREGYANSVQIRVNLWDFFLMFGNISQTEADNVRIQNFQGVYLSPQQAKALLKFGIAVHEGQQTLRCIRHQAKAWCLERG